MPTKRPSLGVTKRKPEKQPDSPRHEISLIPTYCDDYLRRHPAFCFTCAIENHLQRRFHAIWWFPNPPLLVSVSALLPLRPHPTPSAPAGMVATRPGAPRPAGYPARGPDAPATPQVRDAGVADPIVDPRHPRGSAGWRSHVGPTWRGLRSKEVGGSEPLFGC